MNKNKFKSLGFISLVCGALFLVLFFTEIGLTFARGAREILVFIAIILGIISIVKEKGVARLFGVLGLLSGAAYIVLVFLAILAFRAFL